MRLSAGLAAIWNAKGPHCRTWRLQARRGGLAIRVSAPFGLTRLKMGLLGESPRRPRAAVAGMGAKLPPAWLGRGCRLVGFVRLGWVKPSEIGSCRSDQFWALAGPSRPLFFSSSALSSAFCALFLSIRFRRWPGWVLSSNFLLFLCLFRALTLPGFVVFFFLFFFVLFVFSF